MRFNKGAEGSAMIETVAAAAIGILLLTSALQMFVFFSLTYRNTENQLSKSKKAQQIIMILEKSMSEILIPFWIELPEIRVIHIDSGYRQLSIPWHRGKPHKYLDLTWNNQEIEIGSDNEIHRYQLPSDFTIETNALSSGFLSGEISLEGIVTTVFFPFGGRSLK